MWRSVPTVARNGFRTPAKNPLSRVFARYASAIPLEKLRNFGVSAHIDSGKTTLTERILYYTGKIDKIHEVRGKDGVGAVMDSMKQERERGITIKSAATFAQWGETFFNIIDTPGHIDFTVEVERSLRVLDGAILVVCAVGGVQSQTITVDRQMKRYNVPRVVFINKLDRKEAKDVKKTVEELNSRLGINSGLVTVPNGYGHSPLGCEGIVDIIDREYVTFEGPNGVDVTRSSDVPADLKEEVEETRALLIEKLAEVDEELGEKYIMEEDITPADIKAAIRRTTIARTFCPVYCGSAKGNFGVQLVLNAVAEFLPNPTEVNNYGIVVKDGEEEQVTLKSDPKEELIAMVFKLDIVNNKTLAYVRVYQGTLKKGDTVRIAPRGSANWKEAKTAKINKLVKLHSNNFIEVDKVPAGEIAGIEAFECASGDTLVNAMSKTMTSCESIFIPVPVISATLFPAQISDLQNLLTKLKRFEKEDPTFQCTIDHETKDITISGMGELHLDIFVQRLMTEENIAVRVGQPFVQYREYLPASVGDEIKFDYRHKKQSGGRGQFAQMSGYMTRSASELSTKDTTPKNSFDSSEVTGGSLPDNFVKSIKKSFEETCEAGPLLGAPIWGLHMQLQGGQTHEVDSSDFAFNLATKDMVREVMQQNGATLLEPVMDLEVSCPPAHQSDVMGLLSERGGEVLSVKPELHECVIIATAPLRRMFGFISDLRGCTKGIGEFSMEYSHHQEVMSHEVPQIIKDREDELAKREKVRNA